VFYTMLGVLHSALIGRARCTGFELLSECLIKSGNMRAILLVREPEAVNNALC
jgi:hypothetical protein